MSYSRGNKFIKTLGCLWVIYYNGVFKFHLEFLEAKAKWLKRKKIKLVILFLSLIKGNIS